MFRFQGLKTRLFEPLRAEFPGICLYLPRARRRRSAGSRVPFSGSTEEQFRVAAGHQPQVARGRKGVRLLSRSDLLPSHLPFQSALRLDVSHDGWPSVRTSPPSPDVRRPVDRSQRQPDRPPNFHPARDSTVVSALPPDGVPRERSGIPLEGRTSRRRQCGVARGARRRLRFPLRCLGSDRRSHRTSRVTFGEVCTRKKEMQKGEALPDRRLTY